MSDGQSNGALLAVDDLVTGYVPEVDILTGVDLTVREGEIVTVIGPNGAGKSTLIKSIFGLLPPRRGRVRLRGEDLAGRVVQHVRVVEDTAETDERGVDQHGSRDEKPGGETMTRRAAGGDGVCVEAGVDSEARGRRGM